MQETFIFLRFATMYILLKTLYKTPGFLMALFNGQTILYIINRDWYVEEMKNINRDITYFERQKDYQIIKSMIQRKITSLIVWSAILQYFRVWIHYIISCESFHIISKYIIMLQCIHLVSSNVLFINNVCSQIILGYQIIYCA